MNRRSHGRRVTVPRWARLVAVAVAVVVTATVGTEVAYADVAGGAITGSRNGSDPELIQCPAPGGGMTLCLYTSEDLTNPWPMGQNYYPMDKTEMFRLTPGTDASDPANWVFQGYAVSEGQLNALGIGVVSNSLHLWAPGARYIYGAYYIFVPDVIDIHDEGRSSRVYLFKSTNPDGVHGFTYQGRVQTPNWPNGGYASDPMIDSHYDPVMVYANGDNGNCGSISIGQLHHDDMLNFFQTPTVLDIVGIENAGLGSCSGPNGHPYMEGPALYAWNEIGADWSVPWNYFLEFAVKPNAGNAPGCDSNNEAIAYATAWDVMGPYTYGGILMCGSSTEWTTQASIVQHVSNSKILFAYHDGPQATQQVFRDNGTPHKRKTHLMCLTWNGATPNVIPRSPWNMSNC
jgi:hypothetical protein